MYKMACRFCLKSRDFVFSSFWSIKALSPVLKMESTVNSKSLCFDSWMPWSMSCAESVGFFKFFLRAVTSDSHKPYFREGLNMLWSCPCACLLSWEKLFIIGLFAPCLWSLSVRSSWGFFRTRNVVEENEIRAWRTCCDWKEWLLVFAWWFCEAL